MAAPRSESIDHPVEGDRDVVDGPAAQLYAWLGMAAINAILIARLPRPASGWIVRLEQHAYDAGQLLALGCLSWLVAGAWRRWGSRRPLSPLQRRGGAHGLVAFAVPFLVAGPFFLKRDLAAFALRLAGQGSARPWQALLISLVALGVPAAFLVGTVLGRASLRWIGIALAGALSVVNCLVLRNDYPGAHLYLAWASANLAAAAMRGARLPAALCWDRPVRVAIGTALAAISLWSLLVWPSSAVLTELYKLDTSIVVPWLARIRSRRGEGRAAVLTGSEQWFIDRQIAPSIPPSTPPLTHDDVVVVMITIDAMRADLLLDERYRRELPNLFALRDDGVFFSAARSAAPATRTALAAVFMGRYYSQLKWTDEWWLDHEKSVRFPEILGRRGIPTALFVSDARLGNVEGVIGQGFSEKRELPPSPGQACTVAGDVVDAIDARLQAHAAGPLFLYTHLMDPHEPYDEAGTAGTPFERYVREVSLVDEQIGKLRRVLDGADLASRTVLIVSADHGEAFGQHNTPFHTTSLYEELLRVPLIVRVPGVSGRRVERPVSLIDLGPTILDLFGVETPGAFMGQSLAGYLRGDDPALTRPLAAEIGPMRAILLPDGFKVIDDRRRGTEEIYDLARDPLETDNLRDRLGQVNDARLDVLRTFFQVEERDALVR